MAQAATMGPPLSPRETRRSGRRSAPSVSASASKSPDSDQPPREKLGATRTVSSSSNNRNKRLKQEEYEESVEDRKQAPASSAASSGSNSAASNNKAKRKPKDKDKDKDKQTNSVADDEDSAPAVDDQAPENAEEEEEQGITRCVCGSSEDDPDAGEFMIQCETCKVWQHGLCMGYQNEDLLKDEDYYCEQCRPDLHVELLKKLGKRPRQASATARQDPSIANPRVSRSHSPSYLLKQPSKRRNTMNSRDAAFDESLKEIIEATAAEAAAVEGVVVVETPLALPETIDNKKKRKRGEEELNANAKKRTRSASTASDGQSTVAPLPEPPIAEKPAASVPKPAVAKNKRGGRKTATIEVTAIETEDGECHLRICSPQYSRIYALLAASTISTAAKKPGNNGRGKGPNAINKRPPLSHSISHGSGAPGPHEHGTRRNQSSGQHVSTSAADARAYRNTHAYAVSQQTLFTSWNLPDYLSHLEEMLPSDTPQPLEVRGGAAGTSRGESAERTMERGVKVKWPAKRMSVGDMNKRVRSLVEWVGREQASALDRGRRREALEKALREQAEAESTTRNAPDGDDVQMLDESTDRQTSAVAAFASQTMSESALEMSGQTMKLMEELMEELIGFQERFGPGAKIRDRERRMAAAS